MARWRTSAAAAAVVLVATACGHASESASQPTGTSRPQLTPTGQLPLTVKGTGFRPQEKVRVAAKGTQSTSTAVIADPSGTFVVRLHGLKSCDSVTVVATGSSGSHAEFNL